MKANKKDSLEFYETVSEAYGTEGEKSGSLWLQQRTRQAALRLLKESRFKDKDILEVGAGNGLFIIPAARSMPQNRFTAIDFSAKMLAMLSDRISEEKISNIKLEAADASGLPLKDRSFDAIFMVNTLSSIPVEELEQFFREAFRVLKPSGYLYVDFKNRLHPLVTYRIRRSKFKMIVNAYTEKEIADLLVTSGFKVKKKFYIAKVLSLGTRRYAPQVGIAADKK